MLIDELEKSWTVFPSFLANEMRHNCWLFQYLKKRFIITSTCQVKRNKKVNEKVNKCIKRKSSGQGAVLQLSWDCLAAIKGLWDAPSLSWLFPLLAQSSWLDMWEWYISIYLHPPSNSVVWKTCRVCFETMKQKWTEHEELLMLHVLAETGNKLLHAQYWVGNKRGSVDIITKHGRRISQEHT